VNKVTSTLANKSRWANYGLWVAVLALFTPQLLGMFNIVLPAGYETLVYTALDILVLAGILSNPLTKGFLDNK